MNKIYSCLIASVIAVVFGVFSSATVFAGDYLDDDTLMKYSQNDIMFYDPCSGSGGGSASELEGKDNMERIWNWFVEAGIDGVSDNPAVIAGILGNIGKESGYNPFSKNSSGYYGLYQEDSADMRKYVEDKIGPVSWGTSTDDAEKNSAAIAAELEWLQKHDDFKQFVKSLNDPSDKDGAAGARAYAELFLVQYERAVGGSDAIQDPGVYSHMQKMYGGTTYLYQNASGRRDEAEKVYNYVQENGISTSSGGSSSSGDPACSGQNNNNIAQTALDLAWPEKTNKSEYVYPSGKATDAFNDAAKKVYKHGLTRPDCGWFVSVVVRYSGYDKNYPTSLSNRTPVEYANKHSDKWGISDWNSDKSKLKSGDIVVYYNGTRQHTYIVAEDDDGDLEAVEANWGENKLWGHVSDRKLSCSGSCYIIRAKNASNGKADATGKVADSGQNNHDIGASALALAWPYGTDESTFKNEARPEFTKFFNTLQVSKDDKGKTWEGGRSCDRFVYTVLMYAGLGDGVRYAGAADVQKSLAENDNWEEVQMKDYTSTKEYEDGDVIAFGDPATHVGIYVDDNGKGRIAQAAIGGCTDGHCTDPYFGVVKDVGNSLKNYSTIRVYRNKNNKNSTTNCNVCEGGGSNVTELKDGGYSLAEAQEFMKAYREEARKKLKGSYNFQNALVQDGGCFAGTLNNCSAFSEWFVNRYTDAGPNISAYQGADTVKNLLALNKGFRDGGKVPRVYAVFSTGPFEGQADGWWNHTGVVLGIDQEKNQIIIGEASCHIGFSDRYPAANVYDLKKWTNSSSTYGPTYAYTDDILKGL